VDSLYKSFDQMLLHEISCATEFQSYTVNSFRRHFGHVALLSLLSLRLFRIMAVKRKQACTADTYVAWLISMNGEMILRQHFYSLGQNQKFGTDDGYCPKIAPTIFGQ
jgi:DMSO reductase anchor subunit